MGGGEWIVLPQMDIWNFLPVWENWQPALALASKEWEVELAGGRRRCMEAKKARGATIQVSDQRPTHGWAPTEVSFSMTLILYLCHCVFRVCAFSYFVFSTCILCRNLPTGERPTTNSWMGSNRSVIFHDPHLVFVPLRISCLCLFVFRI